MIIPWLGREVTVVCLLHVLQSNTERSDSLLSAQRRQSANRSRKRTELGPTRVSHFALRKRLEPSDPETCVKAVADGRFNRIYEELRRLMHNTEPDLTSVKLRNAEQRRMNLEQP